MNKVRLLMTRGSLLFCSLFFSISMYAIRVVHDAPDVNLQELFHAGKAKYIIHYSHQFNDTIAIPPGSELLFKGGRLIGPIVFNETKLSGQVNLRGSSIHGIIQNKYIDASWLCEIDGVTDDASRINEMIDVCGKVFFPKGNYRLVSAFHLDGKVPKKLHTSVNGHIVICKSNVTLKGEKGTTFITSKPLVTLSVFSQPYDIEHNIKNIRIENITFEVQNDGVTFYEFMHTIKLIGVNGITINNCTFHDFWGDGICLSHYGDNPQTGERTRNQNVRILNNTIIGGNHHSNRNGISVINGKNVLIKGNIIRNTSRKDMPGGIDVEPNNSAYTIDNIQIVNNIFEGIRGGGGAIGIVAFDGGPAHRITIKGNTIRNCQSRQLEPSGALD